MPKGRPERGVDPATSPEWQLAHMSHDGPGLVPPTFGTEKPLTADTEADIRLRQAQAASRVLVSAIVVGLGIKKARGVLRHG